MENGARMDEREVDEEWPSQRRARSAIWRTLRHICGMAEARGGTCGTGESLTGDHDAFHGLLPDGFGGPGPDPVDPPDPKIPRGPTFCRLVVEVVESLVPARQVPCWRLRTDLSPDEKRRYIAIVFYCWKNDCLPSLDSNGGFSEVGSAKVL